MFLLIHESGRNDQRCSEKFTFHNVSINTNPLLKGVIEPVIFTFHNVSINTETNHH